MDKRGSVELINMDTNHFNKPVNLDSYNNDSKITNNLKQDPVSILNF